MINFPSTHTFVETIFGIFDGIKRPEKKPQMELRDLTKEQAALFFYNTCRGVVKEEWEARWAAAIACLESGYGKHYIDHNVVGYHYIDGMGWEYVSANEGMTGSKRKYRKFETFEDCFESLYYLLDKSRATTEYVESREIDTTTREGRRRRMLKFSEGYCPVDKSHGEKVYRIYLYITGVLAKEFVDDPVEV